MLSCFLSYLISRCNSREEVYRKGLWRAKVKTIIEIDMQTLIAHYSSRPEEFWEGTRDMMSLKT